MPYTLNDVYNNLDELDVHILRCNTIKSKSICSQDGYIGLDEAKISTTAELCTILMHDAGHFTSGAFYQPYSPFVLRGQAEYRADKAAILRYIPLEEILDCMCHGITELWEFAEHFGVTEDFMFKAVLYYKEQELASG